MPRTETTIPNPGQIREAAAAIAHSLDDVVYAIVGGAACSILGSPRLTSDVDIVVPRGETRDTRRKLKDDPAHFDVEKRTLHTYYRSSPKVEVEILSPPALFKEPFDSDTPVVLVGGIKVLKPSLILNAKCNSVANRNSEDKRQNDAADIVFCLEWCAANNKLPTSSEVPHASKDFVEAFIEEYGEAHCWTNAGYNLKTGMLSCLYQVFVSFTSADILIYRDVREDIDVWRSFICID